MIRGWGHFPPLMPLGSRPQPISNRPMEMCFRHRTGRCHPRRSLLCPRSVGVVDGLKDVSSRDGHVSSPGATGFTSPLGQSTITANAVGVSTPCGAVPSPGIAVFVFVPFSVELCMYHGRISDPGIRPHHRRVPPASRTPANQQSANEVGVSTPCGSISSPGIIVFVLVRRSCR